MINLLPLSYQAELKEQENRKLISILGVLFLIFLISVVLILFSVKLFIQGQLEAVKIMAGLEEKTLQTSETQKLETEINSTNKNISKLNAFYKKQVDSVAILEKIFKTLPSEINLTAFSWQKKTGQVSISGFSPSREILFSFQNNLEQAKEFKEIYFPPQNWIKSADIDFYVTFKLIEQ